MADDNNNNTLEEGAGSSGDIEQEQGIMTSANTDGPQSSLPGHAEANLQVSNSPNVKNLAPDCGDALNRFEDRLKRKMAEGSNQNTDTDTAAATSELHHSGQDEYYGDEDQVKDFPDVKHVASGSEDALNHFEDRLKRKMAEGNKLHHKDQDESDASNEQGRIIPFNSAEFEDESKPEIGTIEQIEDEDDAAPRPFNSAEFEDESKPEIDFGTESNDDDDGPPLPLTFQRDSLTDVEEKKVAASRPHVGYPDDVQQMDDDETQSHGDEENLHQRVAVAAPENSAASDNEDVDQVLRTAAERNPSLPVLEAYLVEEDTPPQDDTVYEATPLEPELPWWKQRRIRVMLVIFCVLITALTAVVGVTTPRSPGAGAGAVDKLPLMSFSPSQSPTKRNYACFADRDTLKSAINEYAQAGCKKGTGFCPADIVDEYGWPIGSWCVDEVTDMASLFEGFNTFDEDISGWNVGQVTNMNRMFWGATSFNQNLSSWNTSSVTNTSEMFRGATSFSQNLCVWEDTFPYSNAKDIFVDSGCNIEGSPSSVYRGPFCASYCNAVSPTDCFTTRDELNAAVKQYAQGLWGEDDSSKYGWPIGSWCVGNVTDMSELFRDLRAFNEDISGWNVGQVTNMYGMFWIALSFNQDLSHWNTSAVANMQGMFNEASSFNGNISSWNTAAAADMSLMFWRASSFNGDISSWNTAAVTDIFGMLSGASSFNQDLSHWNTSAVANMQGMFYEASSFDGDISSWNTAAVTDMSYMFWRASSLNQEDLSRWDTSAVQTMMGMFYEASSFNGDISSWNTSAVADMSYMFLRASSFNQEDLSRWDTSAVTNMSGMFYKATSFNQNLCDWEDNFPFSSATDIFVDSGCTFQDRPRIEQGGPFCASSCTDS